MKNTPTHQTSALLRKMSAAGLALLAVTMAQASTDYGPAAWVPPCNNNFYTSGNGHKFHVVHDIEGYYASTISYFSGCGFTAASIHYVVNGKKDAASDAEGGAITQMVRDANYAWHARCWNTHSTGTEHEGFVSNPAWYTDVQYQASAGVTKNLASKFGWAKDRNHVIGHNQKTVAGWPAYASANLGIDPNCNDHTDPGAFWDWTKYMGMINNAGADIRGGADAESRFPGNVELFVRTLDNHLKAKVYDSATGWGGWVDHSSDCFSDPSVVSWSSDRLDVFWRGGNAALWQKTWTQAGGWSAPVNLGGQLIGGPDVCSMRPGRLDIFCRGTDNTLQHKSWELNWSGWESLGGVLTADPSAVSMANNRIDVFVRDTYGALNQKFWTSTAGWSGWNQIGGQLIGSPDACSMHNGRLDVFVRGLNNELHHIAWELNWGGWESLGGVMTSDPGCTSWADNRIDVFLRGGANEIHQKYWTSTGGWSGWVGLGVP